MLNKATWFQSSYARLDIKRLQTEWYKRAGEFMKTHTRDEYREWKAQNPYPYDGQKGAYDLYHRWSIFTMYWPTIGYAALVGRE